MTRHIIDHASPYHDPFNLPRALAHSRALGDAGLHPAVKALTRRYLSEPNDALRLQAFLRIVRRHPA